MSGCQPHIYILHVRRRSSRQRGGGSQIQRRAGLVTVTIVRGISTRANCDDGKEKLPPLTSARGADAF